MKLVQDEFKVLVVRRASKGSSSVLRAVGAQYGRSIIKGITGFSFTVSVGSSCEGVAWSVLRNFELVVQDVSIVHSLEESPACLSTLKDVREGRVSVIIEDGEEVKF